MPAEQEEGPEPITLIDESGSERTFRMHDAFEVEGVAYYLVESAEDPSEVMLLREAGGGLETVEDEEFQRIMAALEEDQVE